MPKPGEKIYLFAAKDGTIYRMVDQKETIVNNEKVWAAVFQPLVRIGFGGAGETPPTPEELFDKFLNENSLTENLEKYSVLNTNLVEQERELN